MLHTTYKLACSAGLEGDCKLFKKAVEVFGTPGEYGGTTPLSLARINRELGTKATLWSLRAVYPEQLTAARAVARDICLEASFEASERFRDHIYSEARGTILNYTDGQATLTDVHRCLYALRKRAAKLSLENRPELHHAYTTIAALSPRPERFALFAYEAGIRSLQGWTKEGEGGITLAKEFVEYIADDLASRLEGADESGPGVITEPSGAGRKRGDGIKWQKLEPTGYRPAWNRGTQAARDARKTQLNLTLEGL